MIRSKLSIFVIFLGVLLFISYLLYDYSTYGEGILVHLLSFHDRIETFFHILILCTLFGSLMTGYLINERRDLFEKTKISEKQLQHAAHEWMVTFDSIPYGVLLTDNEFNLIRANRYVADLTGLKFKDLIMKKKCHEVICAKDGPPGSCPLPASAGSLKTEHYEYRDSARKKIFNESVTPLFNDAGELISHIHVLLDITDTKEKEEKLTKSRNAFFNMLKDLDSTNKELKEIYNSLVVTLSNVIDAKSSWTRGHSGDVAMFAAAIGREMALDRHEMEVLNTAALLHDIGKIGTYDLTLDKPEKLTKEEYALIMEHTVKGEEILRPIRGLEEVLPVVRSHHERLDGKGYPDGLMGDKIPLFARIISVADSYDAMISDRPYRSALSREYAFAELRRCSGTQFDPEVVEAFIRALEKEGQAHF
ncbi:MAG: HD domain-containing protein [Nitrospirota bacterium]|nr:HD domain-containing protein [Nitrospirota bacterium]